MNIPETECTPRVTFDPGTATLCLEGESYPEDVTEFFEPILDWIDREVQPGSRLTLVLRLWYLNTGSTKAVLLMIQQLEQKAAEGATIEVVWCHLRDIELMREAGEELLEVCKLPHRIESVVLEP